GEVILHVSLKIHVAKAGYVDQPGAEVQPSAISLPRYRLGEINFPSQSIVEDKFASNPKSILAIEVQSSLTFSRIVDTACNAAEGAHLAEQQGGQAQTTAARSLGTRVEECQTTRPRVGAGHTKVLRI